MIVSPLVIARSRTSLTLALRRASSNLCPLVPLISFVTFLLLLTAIYQLVRARLFLRARLGTGILRRPASENNFPPSPRSLSSSQFSPTVFCLALSLTTRPIFLIPSRSLPDCLQVVFDSRLFEVLRLTCTSVKTFPRCISALRPFRVVPFRVVSPTGVCGYRG